MDIKLTDNNVRVRTISIDTLYSNEREYRSMSVMTQRKNELINFLRNRRNQITLLRMLYDDGWRVMEIPNHSRWQEPRTVRLEEHKDRDVISYELEIDGDLVTIELVAVVRADLLNSDIKRTNEVFDYLKERIDETANGTLLKVILTYSDPIPYKDSWRTGNIRVVRIPNNYEDMRLEEFERKANFITRNLAKVV